MPPYPLPEDLLGSNPDAYYFRDGRDRFAPEALADYLRAVHNPDTIHAMCEDYRAGATYDVELDETDRDNKRIACPVLALWAAQDPLWKRIDVLNIWHGWADDVRGRGLDCGHYLAEEKPDDVYAELETFFIS